jgi:hypothetical protein
MRWILIALLMTGVAFADNICENIRARIKCRQILVRRHEVVVKFNCEEDAQLFARDLHLFVKD